MKPTTELERRLAAGQEPGAANWLEGDPITLPSAAASLGTSPDNLRGAIKRGSLKATKIGRDWLVTPREVERYRLEHRRGS